MYDEEAGLYYLLARFYNPAIGRFIMENTYKGQVDNLLTLNRYTYTHNNPLRYVDPSGHIAVTKGDPKNPTNHPDIKLTLTTFIPDKYLPGTGGSGLGDNRNLWESGSFRTTHSVYIDTETGLAYFEHKGTSSSEVVIFGKEYEAGSPDGSTLAYRTEKDKAGNITIYMTGDEGSNLLAWAGLKISYQYTISIPADKNEPIIINEQHDGFPAYEFSLTMGKIEANLGFDPRLNGQDPTALMGDGTAFKTTTLIPRAPKKK
ncbi:hypothetical protein HP401_28555 [Brevibacillus sp. HB2.2]|nr:hypothetical protein [Brevibacillus sp. HB2.2]